MYGKSSKNLPLGASGFYDYPKENSIPYNNDRLDDAVSLDYSQALSGFQRSDFVASGDYASRIERSSDRRHDIDSRETSGDYATRIGSFTQNLTSTPDLPVRRNSGAYAQRIGNSYGNEKEISHKDQRFHNKGMDNIGRTMHSVISHKDQRFHDIGMDKRTMHSERVYENQLFKDKYGNIYPPPILEDDVGLQGLESPRSILETARSFPVGFEASDMSRSGPFISQPGESTDQGSFERHKTSSQRQKNRRNSPPDDHLESETPAWANRLLTKESSLLSKFRNMKSAINKWTLRRISKPRTSFIKGQGPKVLNLFERIEELSSSSTQDLLPRNQRKEKTNNIASCFCGLFLMIIFVFPVIPVIVIYTDPSDFAQIEITIKFTGYVDANFDIRIMEQDICRQIDTAFLSYSSFYSCDLINIKNGSITANVYLLFRVSNIPNEHVIEETINKYLTIVRTIRTYAYEKNSTKTIKYTFVKQRLVGELPYTRGQTTIDQTTTPIVSTSTTKTTTTIPSTTAKATSSTLQVQTTVEDTSTPVTTSLKTEAMTEKETTTKSDTTTSNVQITSRKSTTTEGLTTLTTHSTITLQSINPDNVTSSEQTTTSTNGHTTTQTPESSTTS
ncbi:uncharacterized protein LOC134712817 [Mytilus trossulus]|uniref:uncharacterized protein LOC134712817 n=1 Tax=Mytilus trossulus TaxID=6551 RepID=UPI003003B2ED